VGFRYSLINPIFRPCYSFTFTQLDAGEPSRAFSFQLNVNEDEVYEVDNCQPSIPASAVMKMMDDLNKTDDLSGFVREMSKFVVVGQNQCLRRRFSDFV
jgi:Chromosome segregation protein Spc25